MTKNEERKVLDQIAKLIASTGEDSYISFAFAGCVQMAKDNIENDFANSMKQQRDNARYDQEETQKYLDRANEEIRTLKSKMNEYVQEIGDLKRDVKAEKKKQIPAGLYRDLWLTVEAQECEAKNEIAKIAEVLSYTEDITETGTKSYINALKMNRVRRDCATKLLAELEKYEPKNV